MSTLVAEPVAESVAESVATRGARPGWAAREGAPLPLGARWVAEEDAYNFALYSKHATRVTLLAFAADDLVRPVARVELDYRTHKTGRVWHCRVSRDALRGARYYAYSIDGPPPANRVEWHAFDPDKVLLDPYAEAVYFPPAFDRHASVSPGSNAGRAPLGVIPPPIPHEEIAPSRAAPRAPFHEADAVIYELHVRQFTRHPSSGVAEAKRGTFAGVIEKIPYLVDLGVTIVELMPVFQYDRSGDDRWGYMPLAFFALHDGYLSAPDPGAGHEEFRAMVDALHRAGIELIVDVVYNHTCEGGDGGPVYGYKGIDNSTYYLMTGDARVQYADFSGTGNTINCVNHAVRKMILDSMRHWVGLGVDGFRFDLASIYARGADGVFHYWEPPIIGEISGDPDFARVRLIAEPWDAGASQLGRAFPGLTWQQWNSAYRDDMRRAVRGDAGMTGRLMQRLYGSDDLFPDERLSAYRPMQSVNYVTCHDGPTLYDLVAYSEKHNAANGHDNTDGPAQNFAWNCGTEGDDGASAGVLRLRIRQAKNLITILLLSNGTPMLRAGDEFLHTQHGNDNPYNQDEPTWLDWSRAERFGEMHRFVKLAIAFRKAHPSLGRSRFWRDDVRWFGPAGPLAAAPGARSVAFCLHGASEEDADLYAMINASSDPIEFTVQEGRASEWRVAIDTSQPSPNDVRLPDDQIPLTTQTYVVEPRSAVVCVRRTDGA